MTTTKQPALPDFTRLLTSLHDSATISTVPKWAQAEMLEAAEAIHQLLERERAGREVSVSEAAILRGLLLVVHPTQYDEAKAIIDRLTGRDVPLPQPPTVPKENDDA